MVVFDPYLHSDRTTQRRYNWRYAGTGQCIANRPVTTGRTDWEPKVAYRPVRWSTVTHSDSSSRPANASITQDLPARGAVSHMGEPGEIKDQMDASDVCTYAQIIANKSRNPAKKSNSRITCQRRKNSYRWPSEARKPNGCVGRVHLCVEHCE